MKRKLYLVGVILLMFLCVSGLPAQTGDITYVPTPNITIKWDGFGWDPGNIEIPTSITGWHYLLRYRAQGAGTWNIISDNLPHLGIRIGHTYPWTLPTSNTVYEVGVMGMDATATYSGTCSFYVAVGGPRPNGCSCAPRN